MSELNHLAEVIENHFTRPAPSSFVHFIIVSDGLTGEQAAQVLGERFNSVWAVTNHIAFWMEYTRVALLDDPFDLAMWDMAEVGSGWPPIGEVNDERWQAARQRALDCSRALATTARTLDPSTLEIPSEKLFGGKPYQALYSIYGHNCNHTAEILTIRHMLGLWVDHEWA